MDFDGIESTNYTGADLFLLYINDKINEDTEKRFSTYLSHFDFHLEENENNNEVNNEEKI